MNHKSKSQIKRIGTQLNIDQVVLMDATPGKWESNCAGEIFAVINGQEVRIGHFQGCAKDAKAVCMVMNVMRGYNEQPR